MHEYALERTQVLDLPLDEAFAFFAEPRNLESITPPWLRFRILEAPSRLGHGSVLVYRLRLFGVPIRWRTEIVAWRPPRGFTDVQVAGPYRVWEHAHRLRPVPAGTEVHDHVRYRLPAGPAGRAVHRLLVRRWLDDIFDFRAARLNELLRARGGLATNQESASV